MSPITIGQFSNGDTGPGETHLVTSPSPGGGRSKKLHTRMDFYRESLQQDVYEYWCMGREKVPAQLMKIREFRTELHATRIKHTRELMELAINHLATETKRCNDQSAAMKATAIGIVQQLSPTDAQEIVTKANTGLDITIANISANEYKDLEKRRQKLQQSPPTFSDIVDPATNACSKAVKPEKGKVFPRGGRGRGGSCPWRARGGGGGGVENRMPGEDWSELHFTQQ